MNTCPICMRATLAKTSLRTDATVYVARYECGTKTVVLESEIDAIKASPECLAGAERIHNAAQALYDAFGYDADAACTPEQRLARSEWRRITMDRDGVECSH